jgi:hypothetical protein
MSLRVAILGAFLVFSLFTNAALLVSDSIRDAIRSAVVRPMSTLDAPDGRKARTPDVDELRTRNAVLGQQLDDLKLDNNGLQARNATLANRLDDVALDNDTLQRRNALLKGQLDNSALDNRRLNAEVRRTASDLAENRVARARAADIASGMAERTQRSIAKNFGSMAAETLPFIGAAAVVGFTAAEIYDACQSLRDVRELNALFDGTVIEEIPTCGYSLKELQHVMLGNSGLADCSADTETRDPICEEPPSLNDPMPTDRPVRTIEAPGRL